MGVRKGPKKCHVLFEWPLNLIKTWGRPGIGFYGLELVWRLGLPFFWFSKLLSKSSDDLSMQTQKWLWALFHSELLTHALSLSLFLPLSLTHTRTHTYTLSLFLSFLLSLSYTLKRNYTLYFTRKLSHTHLILSQKHTHSFTFPHTLFLSRTLLRELIGSELSLTIFQNIG